LIRKKLEIERPRAMKLLINIDVDDLEKAVVFYQSAFGLGLRRLLFDGTVAEMTGASSDVYLLSKPSGSSASPQVSLPRDYRRHWTPLHLDFEVEDVDAAVHRALSAGAKLEDEIQTFPWGRIAKMSDPFGYGFCILEFIGAGYNNVA
jgi:predicted enzyme related to lactoylglutathione lyase